MDRDTAADGPVLARVRELVLPIASDLGLDLYDVEQRGGTVRVTLDTPPGAPGGVSSVTRTVPPRCSTSYRSSPRSEAMGRTSSRTRASTGPSAAVSRSIPSSFHETRRGPKPTPLG